MFQMKGDLAQKSDAQLAALFQQATLGLSAAKSDLAMAQSLLAMITAERTIHGLWDAISRILDLYLMKNDARDSRLVDGIQPKYRDEAYVYGQVTDLAGQLHAIANETPKPPRTSPSPPPIGLDPDRGRADR